MGRSSFLVRRRLLAGGALIFGGAAVTPWSVAFSQTDEKSKSDSLPNCTLDFKSENYFSGLNSGGLQPRQMFVTNIEGLDLSTSIKFDERSGGSKMVVSVKRRNVEPPAKPYKVQYTLRGSNGEEISFTAENKLDGSVLYIDAENEKVKKILKESWYAKLYVLANSETWGSFIFTTKEFEKEYEAYRDAAADVKAKLAAEVCKMPAPGSCFLTTACCDMIGLPDDCFELTTLRRFRDTYMAKTAAGRADVARYYSSAPEWVFALSLRDNRAFLLRLYFSAILPAAITAKLGLNRLTHAIYRRGMKRVAARVEGWSS